MNKSLTFEQALARCLDDLARTGDVEASLRPYPRWTDQLRPLLEAAQAARYSYCPVPEPPGGLAAGRARMLAAAAQQSAMRRAAPSERPVAPRRAFMLRWVAVTWLVLVSVIVLGGGILRAAGNSLPGDWLYPVKWRMEDTRIALTSDAAARARLSLEFVGARVAEIQALVAADRPVPDAVVARMAGDMERALVQAAWAPDAECTDLLAQIAASSRVQMATLAQARQTATPAAEASITRAIAACQQGGEAAAAGLHDPQTFRQRYRRQEETPTPTTPPTPLPTSTPTPPPPTVSPTPTTSRTPRAEHPPAAPSSTTTPPQTPPGSRPTATPPHTPQAPRATGTPQRTSPAPHATTTLAYSTPGPQSTPGAQHTPTSPQSTRESPTPPGPAATGGPAESPPGPPADSGSGKQN